MENPNKGTGQLPFDGFDLSEPVLGNPKTINEAIIRAMCIGPVNQFEDRAYEIIRDFMAQKFSVAYMKAGNDEDVLKLLQGLFESLTKRDE